MCAALNDLLAGTCAGTVSLLVVHPLDTVRVRLQTASRTQFTGVLDCIRRTIQYEGWIALYKGLTPPLIAQGISKATMFFSYGTMRRWFESRRNDPTQPISLGALFISGSVAGVANAMVLSPIELVRNRLQVQYTDKSLAQYKGPIDCARQTIARSGLRGLYAGVGPMIIRDIPGVGAYYAAYEWARRILTPTDVDIRDVAAWRLMTAGAIGGIAFWCLAFPQDTVKSVIQTQSHDVPAEYRTFWGCGAKIIREEGISRLFRGFSVALSRGIPGAAVTFTTYQTVINYLNTPPITSKI